MNVSPEQPILTVEDLSIQFGGLKAVDHLSFSIGPHEIFGLIGPNGAERPRSSTVSHSFIRRIMERLSLSTVVVNRLI